MKRILCIGNRLVPGDCAGPRVYEHLLRSGVPPGVDLVDAGLGGLDLLRFLDGAERVVFADSVDGLGEEEGAVVVLAGEAVAAMAGDTFDHGAGLPYLLRALPAVCERGVPDVFLVGVEGDAGEASIADAAARCVALVTEAPA